MNPHAFPHHFQLATDAIDECKGMTLRDYFAAMAMQGLQANPTDEVMNMGFDSIAQYAYEQADAMLAARQGRAA